MKAATPTKILHSLYYPFFILKFEQIHVTPVYRQEQKTRAIGQERRSNLVSSIWTWNASQSYYLQIWITMFLQNYLTWHSVCILGV